MKRLLAFGLSLGLVAALAVPAVAGSDKVIKQTGNDATTMSSQTVLDNVTDYGFTQYDNQCVHDGIAAGYKGKVNMIQPAGNVDIILGMSFGNLPPGAYKVYLDGDGGSPGSWVQIGSFTADAYGDGEFNYTLPAGTLGAGDKVWGIWVNSASTAVLPCGEVRSILQTDGDLTFSIASL